ncbi:uncharacterized protein [Littorina saxatilis]|uniref:uncharacterized protein isoform X1 n=1 Tax=Littorina saxatilis TaxID=31220 RepID=UPI0038B61BBE
MKAPRSNHSSSPYPFGSGRPLKGRSSLVVSREQPLGYGSGSIGVPVALVRGQGSFNQNNTQFQVSRRSGGMCRHSGGGAAAFAEACDRGGHRSSIPGVLRETVCRPESVRGLATGVGSVSLERLSPEGSVQDGDSSVCQGGPSSVGLGHFHRPDRRILPYSDAQVRSKVAAVPVGRQGVPVQGAAVRAFVSALDLHHDSAPALRFSAAARDSSQSLSGRLVGPESARVPVRSAHPDSLADCERLRFLREPREVRLGSLSAVYVSGHGVRHPSLDCLSCPAEDRQATGSGQVPVEPPPRASQGIGFTPGPDGVDVYPDSAGQSSQTPVSGVSELCLGSSLSRLKFVSSPSGMVPGVNEAVVGFGLADSGRSDFTAPSGVASLYRCFSSGLGSSSGGEHSFRSLGPGSEVVAHQHSGIGSSAPRASGVCRLFARQAGVDPHGQHHCGRVPEQAGGHALASSVQQSMRDSHLGVPSGDSDLSEVPYGVPEHLGRFAQSLIAGTALGVDYRAPGTAASLDAGGQTSLGSVRHPVLSASPSLRVSGTGPGGLGGQRHGNIPLSLLRLKSVGPVLPTSSESV